MYDALSLKGVLTSEEIKKKLDIAHLTGQVEGTNIELPMSIIYVDQLAKSHENLRVEYDKLKIEYAVICETNAALSIALDGAIKAAILGGNATLETSKEVVDRVAEVEGA